VKLTKGNARSHKYHLCLTVEEIRMIANDGISDFFYTNKMLDLIKSEAAKLGNQQSKSGKEESGTGGSLPASSLS
jgi:D-serine deaminase-like pyridoxal phosphate-dependent protein